MYSSHLCGFMLDQLRSFAFIALSFFFFVSGVFACECPSQTIQARSEQADTILIVEVRGHRGQMRHMVSTDVKVLKSYKGSFVAGDRIVLGDSVDAREDTCRIHFATEERGSRWLIFARSAEDRQKGRWLIRNCGRSSPVEFAKHDLRYLDGIDKYRGRTRIYGTAWPRDVRYASNSIRGSLKRGQGMKLTFRSVAGEFMATANSDGFFELLDVPHGFYKVTTDWAEDIPYGSPSRAFYYGASLSESGIYRYGPFGFTVSAEERERAEGVFDLHVPENGDAEINFEHYTSNRVSGRIFGPDGRPIPRALVGLRRYGVDVYDHKVRADVNGRYEISGHLTGKFHLIVNPVDSLSPDHPYGAFYQPGTKYKARSRVIQLGANTVINDADFHVPSFQRLVTVTGRLVFSDGSPVSNGFVRFVRDGRYQAEYDELGAKVNSDGRFRMRLIRGSRGTLTGWIAVVSDGLDGCVEKMQPTDNDFSKGPPRLFSEEKGITSHRNASGIVLRLRKARCR